MPHYLSRLWCVYSSTCGDPNRRGHRVTIITIKGSLWGTVSLFRVVRLAAQCGRSEDTHHKRERPLPWHHSDEPREQNLGEKKKHTNKTDTIRRDSEAYMKSQHIYLLDHVPVCPECSLSIIPTDAGGGTSFGAVTLMKCAHSIQIILQQLRQSSVTIEDINSLCVAVFWNIMSFFCVVHKCDATLWKFGISKAIWMCFWFPAWLTPPRTGNRALTVHLTELLSAAEMREKSCLVSL